MEEQVRKVRRVNIGGSKGFDQTVQLSRKIKKISFEVGRCYYRPTIKCYFREEAQQDGTIEPIYYPGLPSHWMFQEFLGIPVKDPALENETGIVLPLAYSREVSASLCEDILNISNPSAVIPSTVDIKKGYANYIRRLVQFSGEFLPEDQEEKFISALESVVTITPTDEQLKNPDFDEDAMVIESFQAASKLDKIPGAGGKGFREVVAAVADKLITLWSLKNTDIEMAYTYTCNANFDGTSFYGSIEPAENDGGVQFEQCEALAALARHIAQHNFEASGKSAGASPDSEVYRKAFNDYLNARTSSGTSCNNYIMNRPSPNGVIFVYSQECTLDCKKLVKPANATEAPLQKGIMNWSSKKTEKLQAEKHNGIAFNDPDVCHVVYKFTVGESTTEAGKDMSIVAWAGKELIPFDKIASYKQEIMMPSTVNRINNYRPFDLEGCKTEFKKFITNNPIDGWMTEDNKKRYEKGLSLINERQTGADVEKVINAKVGQVNGVDMGINIGLVDPNASSLQQPQVTPQVNPQVTPQVNPQVTPQGTQMSPVIPTPAVQ